MSGIPAFKLVEAGFTQPQVEALSEFLQTEAARRSDLLETEHRLEQKIDRVKAELKADIAGVEHRLEQKISESQIGAQRFILTAILSAMVLNAVMVLGAMVGLVKLLGH